MFKPSWLCSALLLMAGLMPGRKRLPPRRRPRWVRPCVEPLEDRCLPSVTINEFPLPTGVRAPGYISAGRDGNVWFTANDGDVSGLGRITPAGQVTLFSLSGLYPEGNLVSDNNGNIWVGGGTFIRELTPQGNLLHDYPLPSARGNRITVCQGPDGNIWYTYGPVGSQVVGRLTPDGQITEFPIPDDGSGPLEGWEIVPGPDGNVWFDFVQQHALGRVTPTGDVTIFHVDNLPERYQGGNIAG